MGVETIDGGSVKAWAQFQTLTPMHPSQVASREGLWYTGYSPLDLNIWDFGMPEFPLDVRYADFKRRLNEAMI